MCAARADCHAAMRLALTLAQVARASCRAILGASRCEPTRCLDLCCSYLSRPAAGAASSPRTAAARRRWMPASMRVSMWTRDDAAVRVPPFASAPPSTGPYALCGGDRRRDDRVARVRPLTSTRWSATFSVDVGSPSNSTHGSPSRGWRRVASAGATRAATASAGGSTALAPGSRSVGATEAVRPAIWARFGATDSEHSCAEACCGARAPLGSAHETHWLERLPSRTEIPRRSELARHCAAASLPRTRSSPKPISRQAPPARSLASHPSAPAGGAP